jgi:hypothetical protein
MSVKTDAPANNTVNETTRVAAATVLRGAWVSESGSQSGSRHARRACRTANTDTAASKAANSG